MLRFPREWYQIEEQITQPLPVLWPAQALGLALWVYGTMLAKSAGLTAILVDLAVFLNRDTARQRLCEWLTDGRAKARPCDAQVDLARCFPALLRWVVAWRQNRTTLQRGHGRIWRRRWLRPSDLPGPSPGVKMVVHRNPKPDISVDRYIPL